MSDTRDTSMRRPAPIVHLVDDDAILRQTVAMLLSAHGIASQGYPSAEHLLQALDTLAPGCLVVDMCMPGMDGLALQQELIRRGCSLPLIMVTGHAKVASAVRAMKAGAVDYLEKPYAEETLLAAVRAAFVRLEQDTLRGALWGERRQAAAARLATLSPREYEVLRLMTDGLANKMIASELGISPRTVEIHRARVMEKLECRNLAEVLRLAIEAGVSGG